MARCGDTLCDAVADRAALLAMSGSGAVAALEAAAGHEAEEEVYASSYGSWDTRSKVVELQTRDRLRILSITNMGGSKTAWSKHNEMLSWTLGSHFPQMAKDGWVDHTPHVRHTDLKNCQVLMELLCPTLAAFVGPILMGCKATLSRLIGVLGRETPMHKCVLAAASTQEKRRRLAHAAHAVNIMMRGEEANAGMIPREENLAAFLSNCEFLVAPPLQIVGPLALEASPPPEPPALLLAIKDAARAAGPKQPAHAPPAALRAKAVVKPGPRPSQQRPVAAAKPSSRSDRLAAEEGMTVSVRGPRPKKQRLDDEWEPLEIETWNSSSDTEEMAERRRAHKSKAAPTRQAEAAEDEATDSDPDNRLVDWHRRPGAGKGKGNGKTRRKSDYYANKGKGKGKGKARRKGKGNDWW